MKIIIDSREQHAFTFQGNRYADVQIERGALQSGDYSLAGLPDRIAVERKELNDLVTCLGKERERFTRELERARGYDLFAVVVEGSWQDLAHGQYRSRFNPHSACQSVIAMMARYHVPFILAGGRAAAEYLTWSMLRQYLEVARKRWKAIVEAHEVA